MANTASCDSGIGQYNLALRIPRDLFFYNRKNTSYRTSALRNVFSEEMCPSHIVNVKSSISNRITPDSRSTRQSILGTGLWSGMVVVA